MDEHLKIAGAIRELFPGEWISLRAARLHVLLALSARVPELDQQQFLRLMIYTGKNPESEFGLLTTIADKEARSMLIRAFDEGKITTRGVEHCANFRQEMRQPLPLNWWKRTVDSNATFNPTHAGLPVHEVSWVNGCIFRRQPGREYWGEPIATMTDVEVYEPELFEVVKPPKKRRGASADDKRLWLLREFVTRRNENERAGRDPLVLAIKDQFPGTGTREARRIFSEATKLIPEELRAKRGRRPGGSKRGQE